MLLLAVRCWGEEGPQAACGHHMWDVQVMHNMCRRCGYLVLRLIGVHGVLAEHERADFSSTLCHEAA